jgi:hypothetical protein
MDAHERDILAAAVAARITDNTAMLLERMAEWAIGVRDRTKAWLWFLGFAIFAMGIAAYARLSSYWVVLGFVASGFVFEWWLRSKARMEWQRYEFARQHFLAMLESRKTLQSMTKEERSEVKPEVAKWLLDTFLPGGIEHPVSWDDVEEGVLFPATRRMKLESMGLRSRGDNSPNYKEVEYAWDRYGEIDPEREWIGKLRVRGGYVDSSEKLREAFNRHKARYGTKD